MTKFTYKTKSDLLSAAESAGVTLPWSDDLDVLRQEKRIGESGIVMKNRLTVHPMEGFDSTPDGSPSELTLRRAGRFADGGAGLIWFEATAVMHGGVMMTLFSLCALPRRRAVEWTSDAGQGYTALITPSLYGRSGVIEIIDTIPSTAVPTEENY